jgi:hypothetical protein
MKAPIFVFAIIMLTIPKLANAANPLFMCKIGTHTVMVTDDNGALTYQYGTSQKEELKISGSASSGNVFQLEQRFAGIENQLRFKRGDYSYLVYSVEGNDQTGAQAVSGLVVMKGTKTILDKTCSPFAELALPDPSENIPEDSDTYSAM